MKDLTSSDPEDNQVSDKHDDKNIGKVLDLVERIKRIVDHQEEVNSAIKPESLVQ